MVFGSVFFISWVRWMRIWSPLMEFWIDFTLSDDGHDLLFEMGFHFLAAARVLCKFLTRAHPKQPMEAGTKNEERETGCCWQALMHLWHLDSKHGDNPHRWRSFTTEKHSLCSVKILSKKKSVKIQSYHLVSLITTIPRNSKSKLLPVPNIS